MRPKILWLWAWITATLWLGNITGCSKPVAVNDPDPDARVQAMVEAWARNWTPQQEIAASSPGGTPSPDESGSATVSTPTGCGPMVAGDVCDQCVGETACSLHAGSILTPTMSRSHWPRIIVEAPFGQTSHRPIYFRDCPLYPQESHPGRAAGSEAQLHAALKGNSPQGFSEKNLQGLVTQPAKAAFDLMALPVRAIIDPPWTMNSEP